MAGRSPEEVVSILRKGSVGFARCAGTPPMPLGLPFRAQAGRTCGGRSPQQSLGGNRPGWFGHAGPQGDCVPMLLTQTQQATRPGCKQRAHHLCHPTTHCLPAAPLHATAAALGPAHTSNPANLLHLLPSSARRKPIPQALVLGSALLAQPDAHGLNPHPRVLARPAVQGAEPVPWSDAAPAARQVGVAPGEGGRQPVPLPRHLRHSR